MAWRQHPNLSPLQQTLLRLTRAWGAAPVVGASTGVSIVLSVAVTVLVLAFCPVDPAFVQTAVAVAVLVPSLVAPLVSVVVVRLLQSVAEAYDELEVAAATDALTGIPNRRRFFEIAGTLLPAATDTLLVGMVDLDGFKQINDAHGHAVGDRALVAIAHRLQHAVGSYGVVARIGGDEFALLVQVDAERRPIVADALRSACREIELLATLRFDASLGLVEVPPATAIDGAMSLADGALYAAKAARRRRGGPQPVLRTNARA